jgi:hypothetical protein
MSRSNWTPSSRGRCHEATGSAQDRITTDVQTGVQQKQKFRQQIGPKAPYERNNTVHGKSPRDVARTRASRDENASQDESAVQTETV